jgi:hypothetical protein
MPSVFNSLSIKSAYGYRYACLMNGATADEPQDWREWNAKWRKVIVAQSGFEWNFATKVIQIVPGLKPSQVTPQRSFIGNDGRERHMDFGIEVGNRRIAVEVEGWDKTGEDRGKTKAEHDEFNRRVQSLTADGWEVMTVTNAQFMNDPGFYAAQIRQLLLPASSTDDFTPQEVAPQPAAPTPQEVAPQPAVLKDSKSSRIWLYVGLALAVLIVSLFLIVNQVDSGQTDDTVVLPTNGDCPNSYPFKGNVKNDGERIVHAPGQQFYEKTDAEMCFQSIEAAISDGYRKSKI